MILLSIFLIKTLILIFTITTNCLMRSENIKKLHFWQLKVVVIMAIWIFFLSFSYVYFLSIFWENRKLILVLQFFWIVSLFNAHSFYILKTTEQFEILFYLSVIYPWHHQDNKWNEYLILPECTIEVIQKRKSYYSTIYSNKYFMPIKLCCFYKLKTFPK